MRDVIETVKAMKRVSTPLAAISTSDQQATMFAIVAGLNGKTAKFSWDCVRGIRPLTPAAKEFVEGGNLGKPDELGQNSANPTSALEMAAKLPPESILFMLNGHRFVGPPQYDPFVSTGLANLRDSNKASRRMCVLLGPSFSLPAELRQDVMVLDEPLPGDEVLAERVTKMHELAKLPEPTQEVVRSAVDAVRGLSKFAAEQVVAMSLRPEGLDVEECWERKRAAVNQTPGLELTLGGPTFEQVGGLEAIIAWARKRFAGKYRPRVVVHIDEMEKGLAAAQTDTTGVTQDQVNEFLQTMEDCEWDGLLAAGPPGSGKSLFAKALATSFGVRTVRVDLGGMKGSLVGQSEAAIREALKVIKGVGGGEPGSVFVVATVNKLDVLPTELRRRFVSGIWYFDLPTLEERRAIWRVNLAKYELGMPTVETMPDDRNWTGAEIRNCCRMARTLDVPLRKAASYIVPVFKADPAGIERLRTAAEEKWLSASQLSPSGEAVTYVRHGEAAERMIDLPSEPTVQPALIITGPAVRPEEPKPPKGGLN
jgi:hypothetical protein